MCACCCHRSVVRYIESVPNRSSPPAILLRESCREHGKVKKRTLANLSTWPPDLVDGLRTLLKGGHAFASVSDPLLLTRSLPHGHVAAVLGLLKHLGLHTLIAGKTSRSRELVIAMITARVIDAQSKLATARALSSPSAVSTLGESLRLGEVDENELHEAMD